MTIPSKKNHIDSAIPEAENAKIESGVEFTQRETKKRLIQFTTGMALASAVLSGDPSFAKESQPNFKKIVSVGETMIVAEKVLTDQELFKEASYNEQKIVKFNMLSSSYRTMILKYFQEGKEDGISGVKQLKKLGGNLLSYYDNMEGKRRYMNNDNATYNGIEPSLEMDGKSIEELFTRYGTRFSDEGKQIDALFNGYVDKRVKIARENIKRNEANIQKNEEHIRKTVENTSKTEEEIRGLEVQIAMLKELLK